MKTTFKLFGFAAAAFTLALNTSCTKDYECDCDFELDGDSESVEFEYKDVSRSEAKNACDAAAAGLLNSGGGFFEQDIEDVECDLSAS